jgi:diguanylate cyclase (GGDEF)-like protein
MQPLSVIMFDIDHFKSFNDKYGHAIGDEDLRSIAKLTRQSLRPTDIVGRYGGEEVANILPKIHQESDYYVAERLRQQIETVPVQSTDGALTVTISLGVAQMREESKNVEQLLDEADMAMYCAKEGGRNRVAMA